MRVLRRIFFYLLTVAYGILCPVVILYAFGYFFSPKDQTLVRTGLVYIATNPSRATIFLEKSRYASTTPAILSGLMPGETNLSLLLKNFQPWTHRISVEPGKALTFDKILLIPQHWPRREIFPDPIKELIPLPGTNYLLIAKDLRLGDIFVYDLGDAKTWPLVAADSVFAPAKVSSTVTVPKDSKILVRATLGDTEKIFSLDIRKDKPAVLRDITHLFWEKPASLAWEPDEKNVLFDIHGDYLNLVDLGAKVMAPAPNTLSNIRGVGLFNKKIYVLRGTNTLEKLNVADLSVNTLLADASLGETLFGKNGFFQITPLSNEIIVFLGDKGELLTNRLPYRFVENGVLGYQFDPRGDRLLVFQKDRIGILDFSVKTQDNTFQLGPQLSWLPVQGKNIRQVWWVYDASHILFLDDDEVFLVEPQPCGAPHVDYVTRVARNSGIHYDEGTGQIIFIDPDSKKLNALEIIPGHDI